MGASPAGWISKVLLEDSDVAKAIEVAPNLVEVERTRRSDFLLGVVSAPHVTDSIVEPFVGSNRRPSFLVNIPSEAIWTGGAIKALQNNSMAFGGVSELRRAINMDEPRDYVLKEYAYVERRLRQHRSVTSIERLYDRAWRVHRGSRSAINVATSNEYDLTADEVRTTHDRFGPFDILFHTNSMGRITDEAGAAAQELGIELVESGGLFDRLGR